MQDPEGSTSPVSMVSVSVVHSQTCQRGGGLLYRFYEAPSVSPENMKRVGEGGGVTVRAHPVSIEVSALYEFLFHVADAPSRLQVM